MFSLLLTTALASFPGQPARIPFVPAAKVSTSRSAYLEPRQAQDDNDPDHDFDNDNADHEGGDRR